MKSWRRAGALLLLLVTLISTGAVSVDAATSQKDIDKQLSQLRGELSEVSGDEAELLGRLDDIANQQAEIQAKLTAKQAEVDAVQAQLNEAQGKLTEAQNATSAAEAQLAGAQAALAQTAAQLREQAVDAYMGGNTSSSMASFVLHAEDMRELSAANEYLSQVVEDRQAVVEQHRILEGQAQDFAKQVAAARDAAQAQRDTIGKQQATLLSQKTELDALNAQAAAHAQEEQKLLDEVQEKRTHIVSQMDQLQAESDAIAADLRASGGSSTGTVISGNGTLSNPVPGARRTSPFGMRLDPVANRYQLHAGQDFGVPTGTPIHAAADGVVVKAYTSSSYGNYTCINHGGGLATCYAHQSKMLVSVGDHVTRGQTIGLSGSTGWSTGPHLHFEVRVDGNPVNPMSYL